MRQLIIARKDLQMSPGKLAAQVSHASWAFVSQKLSVDSDFWDKELEVSFTIPVEVWTDWFDDTFTKTICEAKNLNHLMKAKSIAEELGLREGKDFFFVHDACFTELTPEENDGTTITCVGFRPLDDEIAHKISKKYQLYK